MPLEAQPPDTITARTNPAPVALRQVWSVYGPDVAGGARVGQNISGIPDINGDGINEFAVHYTYLAEWRIYFGSAGPLSTTPDIVVDSVGWVTLVAGDFWGDGRQTLVFSRGNLDTVTIQGQTIETSVPTFLFYRIDSNRLDTTPRLILDARRMTPRTILSPKVAAADLDGDGADELILCAPSVYREGFLTFRTQLWIYKGGPDFQVDTPTVVVLDDEERGGVQDMFIGRWDNDPYLDIAVRMSKLKFFFGGPGSPWNWTGPDRAITIDNPFIAVLDCDGDSVLDIAVPPGLPYRPRLYRSGSGKNFRTRTLALDDADMTFYREGVSRVMNFGYLSDSLRRYEMLGVGNMGFNGGPNGPDHDYDLEDLSGEAYNLHYPISDVTGDGWNDFMIGYAARGINNQGFAMVFAGGPYIPRDSLTTGVVDIAVAGKRNAISVWPIPVRDELHIAWRGDLSRMPHRFSVHDMLGREVARGEVESWRGEAIWRCAERSAGVYLVSIFDERGGLIATTRIVKQ